MYRYSRAFEIPASSEIRVLFKYLSDPEMISFAGGYPDPRLFDVEGLRAASERAFNDSGLCLQYASTDGILKLKHEVIRLMAQRGVTTSPTNIIITTGSQQAFDLILRVFVNEGDVVLVENPTYSTNIQAAHVHGARTVPVPTDDGGLDVDALERWLAACNAVDRPKLLYTIPTFGNPTGACLSVQRRLKLLELAVKYEFLVVEDDPYGDIRFSDNHTPALRALVDQVEGSEHWVLHMASLSKVIAPGLRVAWTISPVQITQRLSVAKQTADIGSSPWMQAITAEYLAGGRFEDHLVSIRQAYREKCRAMCAALRQHLGDAVAFREPEGGMFVWCKLTGKATASELLECAIARKVMFLPGGGFNVGTPDSSTFRLSFASPSLEKIGEGVERLAGALAMLQR